MKLRQPAVQDTIGIEDLAVAQQMDSNFRHVTKFLKGAGQSLNQLIPSFARHSSQLHGKESENVGIIDAFASLYLSMDGKQPLGHFHTSPLPGKHFH